MRNQRNTPFESQFAHDINNLLFLILTSVVPEICMSLAAPLNMLYLVLGCNLTMETRIIHFRLHESVLSAI